MTTLHRISLALLCAWPMLTSGVVLAQGQHYALLVGIENYEHAKLREPVPLKYAVDDVVALGTLLKGHGFQVVSLDDDSGKRDANLLPTKANIERQLQTTLRKCKAPDTVILAFTGHGLQFAGQKDAYFCPQDARPFADEVGTLVSVSKIYAELEKSFAGVKVILVDACRNDPDPTRGRGLDADTLPPPKGVAALFSCSAGQKAFENDKFRHGVFFHYVLEGLKGEAANKRGEVTFNSLADYVSQEVPAAIQELVGREQLPNQKSDLIGRTPVLTRITSNPSRPFDGKQAGEERSDNGLQMKLVWCPAGTFTMGSPAGETGRDTDEDQVRVTLSRGFWLGKTELTQGAWQRLMGTEPWKGKEYVQEGTDIAATYVSWEDATEFCRKLTNQERAAGRLTVGWSYSLPTEAQWEYACRAGSTTQYSFGDDATLLGQYAWYDKNAWDIGEKYAHRVGQKKSNAWGLNDMHGNVFEWCRDWYVEKPPGGRDPEVAVQGAASDRVYRGGGWDVSPQICRSAHRLYFSPDDRLYNLGFRVALVQSGQ